jgi:hypothetical protein
MGEDGHVRVEIEDPETPSGPKDASQLGDGRFSSRDVREHGHTHHDVECPLGERQSKRIALAELETIGHACLPGQLAGDGQ